MQITLDIPDKNLLEKVLTLVDDLKKDGVKIVENKNKEVKVFEDILNMKSKNSIILDEKSILNPHLELSHDIS